MILIKILRGLLLISFLFISEICECKINEIERIVIFTITRSNVYYVIPADRTTFWNAIINAPGSYMVIENKNILSQIKKYLCEATLIRTLNYNMYDSSKYDKNHNGFYRLSPSNPSYAIILEFTSHSSEIIWITHGVMQWGDKEYVTPKILTNILYSPLNEWHKIYWGSDNSNE